jgi:hypothetical protein
VILPTKYLPHERALLTIGGDILSQLEEPLSVSELWERVRAMRVTRDRTSALSFDWFILALNLLYALAAIAYKDGVVQNEIRR